MLDSKKHREIILLKISEEDFLEKDSKEIVNWLIKNKDLDKITIDKIKSLNISEEYIKGLESISLDNLVKDVKEVDSKIMEIALKIVELRRQLQRL